MNVPRRSSRRIARFAIVATLAWGSAAWAQNPFDRPAANPFEQPKAAPQRVMLRLSAMRDRGTNDIVSHTVLVPDGWQLTGGAWWPPDTKLFGLPPGANVLLTAPDGRQVHLVPSTLYSDPRPGPALGVPRPADGAVNNGLLVMRVPDSPEAWRAIAERYLFRVDAPGATDLVVDPVVPVPALNALLQQSLEPMRRFYAQSNAQMGQQGGVQTSVDGNVFATTARYTLDGKRFEHLAIWASTCWTSRSPFGVEYKWTIDPCVAFRAEEGKLAAEMPLMMAVANSLRMTPAWAQMRADHLAKLYGIQQRGVAERAAIWADSARAISRTITEGYADRSARTDRAAENYSKGFRGVDDYAPVAGSAVPAAQLPSDYASVFGNSRGEYILTNDVNYDPNQDPAMRDTTWEPMRRAQ